MKQSRENCKKIFSIGILIFIAIPAQTVSAFSYTDFFNKYTSSFSSLESLHTILKLVKFGSYSNSEDFSSTKINIQDKKYNRTIKNNDEANEKQVDTTEQDNLIEKQISNLVLSKEDTSTPTAESVCNTSQVADTNSCKKGIFSGCAESLYAMLPMSPECSSFPTQDYRVYLQAKDDMLNRPNFFMPTDYTVDTSVGKITPSSFDQSREEPAISPSSYMTNTVPYTDKELQEVQNQIQPDKSSEFKISNMRPNDSLHDGQWEVGNATLFAINGGGREAGQIMNKQTAFGYNPYDPNTCIVSLPFKTVDRFFGTTLDDCIKRKDRSCIMKMKTQVKDRAIEVVMVQTGARGIFPLGDLGPAEWAVKKNNAVIDLTRCVGNKLRATGKDLVRFRPAPTSNSTTS